MIDAIDAILLATAIVSTPWLFPLLLFLGGGILTTMPDLLWGRAIFPMLTRSSRSLAGSLERQSVEYYERSLRCFPADSVNEAFYKGLAKGYGASAARLRECAKGEEN